MKKIVKILSILCLLFMSFLSSVNLVDKNKDINLDSLITNANAQSEWWNDTCWWCPSGVDIPPSGEIAVPVRYRCAVVTQIWVDGQNYASVNYVDADGIDCDFTVVPSACTPYNPCDEYS